MKGWKTVKLGDLTDILSGFAFPSEGFGDSGDLPLVRIRDVVPGESNTWFSGDFDPTYVIDAGDILVGMDGEFNRARWKSGRALLNQRVCRVQSSSEQLDEGFLFWLLPKILKVIEDATPFVTVKHLSVKQLRNVEFSLPPLPEQRRIAAILDQAEALRAKRRVALAKLDTLAQSIFIEMFGEAATASQKWSMTTVDEVADVQGGLQLTSSRKDTGSDVPYLRVANVQRGFLDLGEIKTMRATAAEIARTTLMESDLLIVEGHGNPEEIGRCALWDGSIHPCIHQNHLIRARFNSALIDPRFSCEYLNSPGGRQYLLRSGKTTSGLNTISVSNVRKTPMILPPIELQRQFASRLTLIDKNKTRFKRGLFALDTLFASLQHRAFRGEL